MTLKRASLAWIWALLAFVFILLVTTSQAQARPDYLGKIPTGMDKSCALCHDGAPSAASVNDLGNKWVAAGMDFNAMKSSSQPAPAKPVPVAAPAASPSTTASKAPAAAKTSSGEIKQTVTFAYGDKAVKVQAINKKSHLQVAAGVLTDLFGVPVNDKAALIPIRQVTQDMGLTVSFKSGKVDFYGTVAPKGQFGKNKVLALAGYVGPETCQGCHSGMVDKWKTTKHATMVQDMKDPDAWVLANFSINDFFSKEDADYAVAQGQRFIAMKDGRLQYMPATWNVATNQWNKAAWSNYGCGKCHNTGFNAQTGYWAENGITCEGCHGPGAEHAASADPSKIKVNTGVNMCQPCHDEGSHRQVTDLREDAEAEEADPHGVESHLNVMKDFKTESASYGDACIECHSADFRVAKDAGKEEPTWAELKDGPRYGITCMVCHDPHQNTGKQHQLRDAQNFPYEYADSAWQPDEASALCVDCHTNEHPVEPGKAPHHPQKEWMAGQLIDLDIAAPNGHQCTTCHMPNSNHKFQAGMPTYTYDSHGHEVELDVCGQCHSDMTADKIASIQKDTEAASTELKAQLDAFKTQLEAAKAAGADVTKAQKLYDANVPNIGMLSAEHSWGLHNNDLTQAVIKKAKADFAELKTLLAGY